MKSPHYLKETWNQNIKLDGGAPPINMFYINYHVLVKSDSMIWDFTFFIGDEGDGLKVGGSTVLWAMEGVRNVVHSK